MTNPMGKTRKSDNPYLVYENMMGWQWKVLKANTINPHKKFASWFCEVTSPYTGGSSDLGDTYIADVVKGNGFSRGRLVFRDPVVTDNLIPDPSLVPDTVW